MVIMRWVDVKKREDEIIDLVVASYIKESRPISSSYLCEHYHLPFSSATVRNVMESLEKKGYLSHIHISSGRVPTKLAFKHYVDNLNKEEIMQDESHTSLIDLDSVHDFEETLNQVLDILSNISGYTSLIGVWGFEEMFFFRGTRFILEQPEFEDIDRLRKLFYALEVKISQIQNLLAEHIDDELSVLIGDEIGFEEISECSLLISGLKEDKVAVALAVLGPMRMNYIRALRSLSAVKHNLEELISKFI